MSASTVTQPFDGVAAAYDANFTDRLLGRWLRAAVWEQLERVFRPGDHILELGCGTGEDAGWLARQGVRVTATDASPAMLAIARRKAATAGVAERITFAELDLEALGALTPARLGSLPLSQFWEMGSGGEGLPALALMDVASEAVSPVSDSAPFDGAFSNFGALNCLPDRRPLAQTLAGRVRPGGRAVLVVMGPYCPWEVAWYLTHGQPRTALRRFRAGAEARVGDGSTVRVWYPSPRRLRTEFRPWFRHVDTVGIGVLLPPSYVSHLVERWTGFFAGLRAIEQWIAPHFPWTWLNDHYLAVFERR